MTLVVFKPEAELLSNADVTQVKQQHVTCNTEKEKEIEIEITVPKGTVCRTKDVRLVIEEWNKTEFKPIERIRPDSKRGEMLRKRVNNKTYYPGHIEAGDIMIFGDNCLVVFYKSFDTTFGYTKIGHIQNIEDLGKNDIVIKFNVVE